jgi:hypothetical protein
MGSDILVFLVAYLKWLRDVYMYDTWIWEKGIGFPV